MSFLIELRVRVQNIESLFFLELSPIPGKLTFLFQLENDFVLSGGKEIKVEN